MIRILIAGLLNQTQNYVAAVSGSGMEPLVSLALPEDLSFPGFDGLLLPGGADIDPATASRFAVPAISIRSLTTLSLPFWTRF